jgi:2,5-furandicarboxylate decarboxylase 1
VSEPSIRGLAERIDRAGGLLRVGKPVDPRSNLAALAWRARHERGKAVWFDSAFGHFGWRVASQLLAERSQWAVAFGLDESQLLFALRDRLAVPCAPIATERAPVKAVRATADKLDLARLPAVQLCAEDSGRRILGVALAHDAARDRTLVSLADLQLLGRTTVSCAGLSPALAALHARSAAAGKPLAIAVTVGADPALYLAAALAEMIPDADLALAGGLKGAPLEMTTLEEVGLPVPAYAELAIAGTLSLDETVDVGPRGGVLGLYAPARQVPVFRAWAVVHRIAPVLYAMQVGAGRGDLGGAMALATEVAIAQHLRNIEGGLDILDVRCHAVGADMILAVKLRPRVEGQSKTALIGALSGPAVWPKLAIGVDEDVDAADLRDVFWSAASRTHAERDVGMVVGVRAHPDDPASPLDGDGTTGERVGTRWYIDSTMPPLTQPERREAFARAIPRNLAEVPLKDFLPPGVAGA